MTSKQAKRAITHSPTSRCSFERYPRLNSKTDLGTVGKRRMEGDSGDKPLVLLARVDGS